MMKCYIYIFKDKDHNFIVKINTKLAQLRLKF